MPTPSGLGYETLSVFRASWALPASHAGVAWERRQGFLLFLLTGIRWQSLDLRESGTWSPCRGGHTLRQKEIRPGASVLRGKGFFPGLPTAGASPPRPESRCLERGCPLVTRRQQGQCNQEVGTESWNLEDLGILPQTRDECPLPSQPGCVTAFLGNLWRGSAASSSQRWGGGAVSRKKRAV